MTAPPLRQAVGLVRGHDLEAAMAPRRLRARCAATLARLTALVCVAAGAVALCLRRWLAEPYLAVPVTRRRVATLPARGPGPARRPRASARRRWPAVALGALALARPVAAAAPPAAAPPTPADTSRPIVAQHPLEFVRTPKLVATELRRLRSEYLRLLVATGARAADPAELESALATLDRLDCRQSDACLGQLAQRTGARSAMYVAVDQDPSSGTVTATGRLVSTDGEPLTPRLEAKVPATASAGARGFVSAARQALAVLTDQLAPGRRFQAQRTDSPTLAHHAGSSIAAARSLSSAPQHLTGSGARPRLHPAIPWVATGTGAALAVGGGLLLGLAAADSHALRTDGAHNLAAADVERYATARNRERAGATLLATGAAIATAGLVGLLWKGAPEAELKVSPSVDRAQVSISGRLP